MWNRPPLDLTPNVTGQLQLDPFGKQARSQSKEGAIRPRRSEQSRAPKSIPSASAGWQSFARLVSMVVQDQSSQGRLHRVIAGLGLLDSVNCCWNRKAPPTEPAVIAQCFGGPEDAHWIEVELAAQATAADVNMIEELLVLFAELYRQAKDAERLLERAQTDPLTGLWNRRGLEPLLAQGLGRCKRSGTQIAVLAVDVDDFKMLNDTYGHDGGDRALTRIARVLEQSCRPGDVVARLGGDEMLVLLHDCDAQGAAGVAKRISQELNQDKGLQAPELSLSIGIADTSTIRPQDPRPPAQQLLKAADQALYRVKESGKGHFAWI